MWCTPLTPALRRQRVSDLCELGASLAYTVSFRLARATLRQSSRASEGTAVMSTNLHSDTHVHTNENNFFFSKNIQNQITAVKDQELTASTPLIMHTQT